MSMMGSRVLTLDQTLEGFRSTGVPLVAKSTQNFYPAGFTDDQGLYYFVPRMAQGLGISLEAAVHLFFISIILAGWLSGSWGFWRVFRNLPVRFLVSVGFLAFSLDTYFKIADVYLVMVFAVSAFVPRFLAFYRGGKSGWKELGPWFILGGIILGYCNFIRSQSGSGILVFLLAWLILNQQIPWKKKAAYFLILLGSFQVPGLHFHRLEKQRDAFLQKVVPQYQPENISHPFWHSVYIGLGYLPNPYGLEYRDGVAADKVASVNPKIPYCSAEYEKVLETATLDLIKKDPFFILKTVLMKAFKLLVYFLLFANVGLLFFFYVRPGWREIFPMAAGVAFYSMPGLLVVPFKPYVLGMITMAVVFGFYMTGLGIEKYLAEKTDP